MACSRSQGEAVASYGGQPSPMHLKPYLIGFLAVNLSGLEGYFGEFKALAPINFAAKDWDLKLVEKDKT